MPQNSTFLTLKQADWEGLKSVSKQANWKSKSNSLQERKALDESK